MVASKKLEKSLLQSSGREVTLNRCLTLLFILFLTNSCSEKEGENKVFVLERADNLGDPSNQDYGFIVTENKRDFFAPVELNFTLGQSLNWNGFSLPGPSNSSDNYRALLGRDLRPVSVTPQIIGGRVINLKSIIDRDKDRLVSAYVKNTVTFADKEVTFAPAGTNQGLVYRESPDGSVKWFYQIQGGSRSLIITMTTDQNYNTYMVVDYNLGSSLYINGNKDIDLDEDFDHALIKVDRNGEKKWIRYFQVNNGQIRGSEMYGDRLLLLGYFSGTMKIGQNHEEVSNGAQDAFALMYDDQGTYLWSRSIGESSTDRFSCGHIDESSVYLAGHFTNSPKVEGRSILSSTNTAALVKFGYDGKLHWINSLKEAANSTPIESNCLDGQEESLYWATYTNGEPQPQHGPLLNLSGKRVLLFQVSKRLGKIRGYDTIEGLNSGAVVELTVDGQSRLVLGLVWTGSELKSTDGEVLATNAGGRDAFAAFYSVDQF